MTFKYCLKNNYFYLMFQKDELHDSTFFFNKKNTEMDLSKLERQDRILSNFNMISFFSNLNRRPREKLCS